MRATRTRAAARALAVATLVAVAAPAAGQTARPDGRPFQHSVHQAVRCGDCHALDQRHRGTRSWTAADCAACHHGREAPAGCTACHEPGSYEPPRAVTLDMGLSVWSGSRLRALTFEHDRHAAIGCLDCHRGGMDLPPARCAACHTDHHRPAAECASCHVAPDPAVHDRAAHLTCGGAGCHSAVVTQRPVMSRSMCLVCHTEQRDHRPGRECVDCHVKPERPPERTDHGNP